MSARAGNGRCRYFAKSSSTILGRRCALRERVPGEPSEASKEKALL